MEQTDGQIAALPNAPIGVGIISYVVRHCTVNYVAICVLVCSDFVLHTHTRLTALFPGLAR